MTTWTEYADLLPEPWRSRASATPPQESWWRWELHGRPVDVQIARAPRPDARVRVMVIHGAGGHSGALWPAAAVLADNGAEPLAPDLPLYGRTRLDEPGRVRYADWVDLLTDLVIAETDRDPRPLIVFGASMGGMLAYEVAARTGRVAAAVATCLLDLSGDRAAVRAATRWPLIGQFAPTTLPTIARFVGDVRIPIGWIAPLDRMSADSRLSRLCATDRRGGGGRVPIGFLADAMTFAHTPPEEYAGPAVTLVHPAEDAWTPPALSRRFLDRIAGPTSMHLLDGCGHYPIERPGIDRLAEIAAGLARDIGGVAESTA
ncbi:alpha/beta fold hydrolase [Gordonia soli]|uniref:AB hydrolase-1 domain-containing protein n=1 Tax=Gordonia soli NBRC 108243 TaxID=1223545 RepID=M0QI44_9ACTN|nr:alpha/beta hydrolase [Gordonia soli]GAC68119.1 hypothetical protein GS4_11_03910 [Gordonia soli NBRC 108243]